MSDETPTRTAAPDADAAVTMLAELRARVEEATAEIDRLTAELDDRTRALDDLESTTDALLGVTDTPVVLVGEDRRVRALTRGAAELLGASGASVGRALSTVLPDDLAAEVAKRLDDDDAEGTGAVLVERLEGGGALVVLHPT
jgi:uncharacterized small protein (DUF1192 family)